MTPRGYSEIPSFLYELNFPDQVGLSVEEYCREVLSQTANARLRVVFASSFLMFWI